MSHTKSARQFELIRNVASAVATREHAVFHVYDNVVDVTFFRVVGMLRTDGRHFQMSVYEARMFWTGLVKIGFKRNK